MFKKTTRGLRNQHYRKLQRWDNQTETFSINLPSSGLPPPPPSTVGIAPNTASPLLSGPQGPQEVSSSTRHESHFDARTPDQPLEDNTVSRPVSTCTVTHIFPFEQQRDHFESYQRPSTAPSNSTTIRNADFSGPDLNSEYSFSGGKFPVLTRLKPHSRPSTPTISLRKWFAGLEDPDDPADSVIDSAVDGDTGPTADMSVEHVLASLRKVMDQLPLEPDVPEAAPARLPLDQPPRQLSHAERVMTARGSRHVNPSRWDVGRSPCSDAYFIDEIQSDDLKTLEETSRKQQKQIKALQEGLEKATQERDLESRRASSLDVSGRLAVDMSFSLRF